MTEEATKTTLQPTGDEADKPDVSNPSEGTSSDTKTSGTDWEAAYKKLQSAKDKEVAAIHAQYQGRIAAQDKQIAELDDTLGSLIPEEEREKYRARKLEREIATLKAEKARIDTISVLSREYGVPADVLSSSQDLNRMTVAAMDWLKEQLATASQTPVSNPRKERAEAAKESGGTMTALSERSPAPEAAATAMTEARFRELEELAAKGGKNATAARLEFYKNLGKVPGGTSKI